MPENLKPFIVVGVSDSVASKAALRWAADEARRRGSRLVVVRVWEPAHIASYVPHAQLVDAASDRRAVTCELASALYGTLGAKLPSYLFTKVIEGMPDRVLADESAGADMIVLGSSSAPTFIGGSIGPVIRSCLSRGHCPVVVINPEDMAGRPQHRRGVSADTAAVA
jgi:nucleotide-binding universal stress UspA family protein